MTAPLSGETGSHQSRRLRRNLSWQTIANLGVAALGALYLIWLGRTLGAERFGLFALATGVSTFVYLITDFRMQEAMVRFLALFANEPERRVACTRLMFMIDALVRVAGCLVLIAMCSQIARWLARDEGAADIIAIAALAGFGAKIANGVSVGILRSAQRFDWHAAVLLATWVVKLTATVIALHFAGPDVRTVLIVALACDALGNLVILAGALRELRRMPRPATRAKLSSLGSSVREIRTFLASAAGISASDSLVRELDTTLVAWFMSLTDVGIYRMAKNIVALLWRAVDPVYVVLMPEFANYLATDRGAQAATLARKATRMIFFVAGGGYLASLVVLPLIVPAIIGESFDGTVSAALVMMVGVVLGAPFIWTHAYSVAAGKLYVQLMANVIGASLAALCFVAFTPSLGAIGASIGFAVALAAPFLISAFFWRRQMFLTESP